MCKSSEERKEIHTVINSGHHQSIAAKSKCYLSCRWKEGISSGQWFASYNPKERIEVFWNKVFQLQPVDGDHRYKLLPVMIKSVPVLGQTNAESECSLSVNARIVNWERTSVGEKTIVGLMSIKMLSGSVIQFLTVEMIPMTQDLKKSCQPIQHTKETWKGKRENKRKRRKRLGRRRKDLTGYKKREKKYWNEGISCKSEEDLNEQKEKN